MPIYDRRLDEALDSQKNELALLHVKGRLQVLGEWIGPTMINGRTLWWEWRPDAHLRMLLMIAPSTEAFRILGRYQQINKGIFDSHFFLQHSSVHEVIESIHVGRVSPRKKVFGVHALRYITTAVIAPPLGRKGIEI